MPYNEKLAKRIREILSGVPRVVEKQMFGGLAFMVNGRMCVTVGKERIMCRVDPALHEELVRREGCQAVTMRGREYRGYLRVSEGVLGTRKDLDYWVGLALDFNKAAKRSQRGTTAAKPNRSRQS